MVLVQVADDLRLEELHKCEWPRRDETMDKGPEPNVLKYLRTALKALWVQ